VSVSDAQSIVDSAFAELPKPVATGAVAVFEKSKIEVQSVSYGNNKDVILSCRYQTIQVLDAIKAGGKKIIDTAYSTYIQEKEAGKNMSATKLRLALKETLVQTIDSAAAAEGEVTLQLFEVKPGYFRLYLSDEAINTCFGGLVEVSGYIDTLQTAEYNGEEVDIKNNETVRTALKDCFKLTNYDSEKPDTGNFVVRTYRKFVYDFDRNFIQNSRWLYLAQGLGTTLSITALSGLMGIVLGFLVAIVRCTNQMTGRFAVVDKICRVYLTVIRGTPVMVQLLIIYFVLLLPIGVPKFLSAVLCFGLNSGAYVAEIVRGGIMSVDKGQSEAGRSLGFSYSQTMIYFVIPQAFKAVLPALANEFITLLKESSVAFYIGVADLTQGGLKIRSLTYSNFMPLVAVALIYLVIVVIMTKLVGILERRLRKSER
jgi:His/Glu/Gln/Arg/opine family amino acid ABC transporter permease subunit